MTKSVANSGYLAAVEHMDYISAPAFAVTVKEHCVNESHWNNYWSMLNKMIVVTMWPM